MCRLTLLGLLISAPSLLVGQSDPFLGLAQVFQAAIEKNLRTVEVDSRGTGRITLTIRPDPIQKVAEILIGVEHPLVGLSVRLPDRTTLTPVNAKSKKVSWEQSGPDAVTLPACSRAKRWFAVKIPQSQNVAEYSIEANAGSVGLRTVVCATFIPPLFGAADGKDVEVVGTAVRVDQEQYQPGDPVKISVPVKGAAGRPVRNAVVEGEVRVWDNVFLREVTQRVRLFDPDSDGSYSATFPADGPGKYFVRVTITGRAKREVGDFRVNPPLAKVLSALAEAGSRNHEVVIRMAVFAAGQYEIQAIIRVNDAGNDQADFRGDLAPVEQTIRFDIRSSST